MYTCPDIPDSRTPACSFFGFFCKMQRLSWDAPSLPSLGDMGCNEAAYWKDAVVNLECFLSPGEYSLWLEIGSRVNTTEHFSSESSEVVGQKIYGAEHSWIK